jgi:hypothetical protein
LVLNEHKKVQKRAKKVKVVVSKEYHCVDNTELVDIFYELSRAYFKSGDYDRGLHFGHIAKVIRTINFKIYSGSQAMKIKGIGSKTKQLIDEFLATKQLESRFAILREKIAAIDTDIDHAEGKGEGLQSPAKRSKIGKI